MTHDTTRVLVVEDDPEEALLFREAFGEIADNPRWRNWTGEVESVHAETLQEALLLLAGEEFDLVLLDTSLPDSNGLHPLLSIQKAAPELAVIVLIGPDDMALSVSALRAGAQDCIVRTEIDCFPLARAIRQAVERQRLSSALRSVAFVDELTGLLNRVGFLALAGRDYSLGERFDCNLELISAELLGERGPDQAIDLRLLEAAEAFREVFGDNGVAGRVGRGLFAGAELRRDRGHSLLEPVREALSRRCGTGGFRLRTVRAVAGSGQGIVDLLRQAESAVCENELSKEQLVPG